MPYSPVNCLIDKSRLPMPDYKARFILNPINIVWSRLFLYVREIHRKRIQETDVVWGAYVSSVTLNACIKRVQCGKNVHLSCMLPVFLNFCGCD